MGNLKKDKQNVKKNCLPALIATETHNRNIEKQEIPNMIPWNAAE